MSTYKKITKHPVRNVWEEATWHDDFFGQHKYGVVFPSDRANNGSFTERDIAYNPELVKLETKEN